MSAAGRRWVFLPLMAAFLGLFGWALTGLPPLGHYRGPYGNAVNRVSVEERHITDAVTAVIFDIRGFDTLGEEFIIFASVMGVALLLRKQPGDDEPSKDKQPARRIPPPSDAVRVLTVALVGPVVLFGIYIVTHGHVTPGGGFQGGVILATAPLLVYLAGEFDTLRKIAPQAMLEAAEAAGAGGYVLLGAIGPLAQCRFLENVLPFGEAGDVFSGGLVPLINLTVGVEVAGGFLLLLITYLQEMLSQKEEEG